MGASGLARSDMIEGVYRLTMQQLAAWTAKLTRHWCFKLLASQTTTTEMSMSLSKTFSTTLSTISNTIINRHLPYTWLRILVLPLALFFVGVPLSHAQNEAAIDEMSGYLDFSEYGGGVIFAEQIPKEEYDNIMVIDARDADQFAENHIPGAVNLEWRRVLNERDQLPDDKMILIYCNTGTLSAQAGFALRVAGHDNVRILQGGFKEWKAKGGFDANARASGQTPQE